MKSLAALLLATSLTATLPLRAQTTVTWTGAGGDNLWTTAGNWDTNATPNLSIDTIIIGGASTQVVVPAGSNFILGTSWGSYSTNDVIVNSGATLSVAGSLRTNAGLNDDAQSYIFNGTSTLALESGGYIQHGHYIFNDDSQLTAAGANAVRAGSIIRFYGNSGFGTLAAGAIADGDITFYGTREVTFTPGTVVGGYINLDDNTSTTLNQTATFVADAGNPSLYFQLRGSATATITAAGALQSTELRVGGTSTAYLNITGALAGGTLAIESDGTVTVGADNPLSNAGLSFADWTSSHTGGTLDLHGHTFTTIGASSTSFANNPANEGTITSSTAATLVFNVTAGTDRDGSEYAGAITGAISVVKNGSGLQTLGRPADAASGYSASVLSYTGSTTVNAGRLYIQAPLLHSDVTVNDTGIFGGISSANHITVHSGGTLDPSPGPIDQSGDTGTLQAADVTFASGSRWIVNLGDATGTAGASYNWDTHTGGWSLLDVTGTLALPGGGGAIDLLVSTGGHATPDFDFVATPANFDPTANYSFRFASAGSITGFDSTVFNIGYDPLLPSIGLNAPTYFTGSWSVSMHDNGLYLNYTGASAVPEPSTYAALLGASALGLVAWRRRRRTAAP